MRHFFQAAYASSRGRLLELYKVLRLQKYNPAHRRQFDFFTEIELSPTRTLPLSGNHTLDLRKREDKIGCRKAGKIWEREVASRYLHSYLAASLSRFFPVPIFHRH